MGKRNKLVCGVGINDCGYPITRYSIVDGKRKCTWNCPYYLVWKSMITRCYSERELKRFPSYRGAVVCDDWLIFSNFKLWMESQVWQDSETKYHLDKDLLSDSKRGKLYSPETCVFVKDSINSFLTDVREARGDYPLGVTWRNDIGKFRARVNNPLIGKSEHLGHFDCPHVAHLAYVSRKTQIAAKLAAEQTDHRVSNALLNKNWS